MLPLMAKHACIAVSGQRLLIDFPNNYSFGEVNRLQLKE